jgi:hypothetical protein
VAHTLTAIAAIPARGSADTKNNGVLNNSASTMK